MSELRVRNSFQRIARDGELWVRGLNDLRPENQALPPDLENVEPKKKPTWDPGVQFFLSKEVRKIWVVVHAKDWTG